MLAGETRELARDLEGGTNAETRACCNALRNMPVRCLIVDDNLCFRQEVGALLQEEGIDVVGGAACGAEALQQIGELEPNVVLLDIDLDGESGLTLARRLPAVLPVPAPPVILISTHDESEYADLIAHSPALGFVAKTELSAATILRVLAAADGGKAGRPSPSDGRPGTGSPRARGDGRRRSRGSEASS